MGYIIGIDGGGSKTTYTICDQEGLNFNIHTSNSISYHEYGLDYAVMSMSIQIDKLIHISQIKSIVFGLPCFGEDNKADELIKKMLSETFPSASLFFHNDAEIAHAGALNMEDGIVVVSGTGSIAYGRVGGKTGRCGGWSEFYSDEGSGYWLGRKCLELFTKQSDGRLEKTILYQIIRKHFGLNDDYEIITAIKKKPTLTRYEMAVMQKLLYEAALNQDKTAIAVYAEAGMELAEQAISLKERLRMTAPITVSYAGGIFKAGNLILDPFIEHLGKDYKVIPPAYPPYMGALFMAADYSDNYLAINALRVKYKNK